MSMARALCSPPIPTAPSQPSIAMSTQMVRSGRQQVHLVSSSQPTHAGVDPFSWYVDRQPGDNVRALD